MQRKPGVDIFQIRSTCRLNANKNVMPHHASVFALTPEMRVYPNSCPLFNQMLRLDIR